MSLAVYEALAMKKALEVAHFRARRSLSERAVGSGSREAHPRSFFYRFAEFFGVDPGRERSCFPRLLRGRLRGRFPELG
jgi:hypothetical protein